MAKTILVGNTSVGKTNILLGFTEKYFSPNQNSTIGVDFKLKAMKISGTTLKLQIWDTAGQCRFRNITRTFFQGSSGVMFVYSVDSQSSFSSIPSWVEEANEVSCGTSQVRLLLANKCDLQESRVISSE
jgi:Ras-related protein Rab-1A